MKKLFTDFSLTNLQDLLGHAQLVGCMKSAPDDGTTGASRRTVTVTAVVGRIPSSTCQKHMQTDMKWTDRFWSLYPSQVVVAK